jgi:hypothetical protein
MEFTCSFAGKILGQFQKAWNNVNTPSVIPLVSYVTQHNKQNTMFEFMHLRIIFYNNAC